jgi:Spy/CpxP family protein refolding chaperone
MGVELTEAQQAQIKQIHEANKPDALAMEELKAIHEAQRAGYDHRRPKGPRQGPSRTDAVTRGESVHQQVLAVLTPEQRQQIEARKAERQKQMEERRQNAPAKTFNDSSC